jgi:hypothetical protein
VRTKFLEVRDRATFIPVAAISMMPSEPETQRYWLMRRAGFSADYPQVLLVRLLGGEAQYDPYAWASGSRTMRTAHLHIRDQWESIADGDVVDVEFILGETSVKKVSERLDE